jgi:DNA-binding transcriptional ArsR family regulator
MAAAPEHPDSGSLTLERVLHALSDPIRLSIVRELATCEYMGCKEMSPHGVTRSTLSHHLKVLREAGLTFTRVVATQRFVALRYDDIEGKFPGLLAAVGVASERADAGGSARNRLSV